MDEQAKVQSFIGAGYPSFWSSPVSWFVDKRLKSREWEGLSQDLEKSLRHTTVPITNLMPMNRGYRWLYSSPLLSLGVWHHDLGLLHRKSSRQKPQIKTSVVAQWLRIRLPMQGTRVRALVREDPTCRGETKPVRHNYWACALEPASDNYWSPRATTTEAHVPTACAPWQEKPPLWEACTLQWRAAPARLN